MKKFVFPCLLSAVFLLTILLLLSPIHLTLDYQPVSSLYIFGNLPLFAVLYFIWFALILVLLRSRKDAPFQIFILCLFSMVFLGFWTMATPWGESPDGQWIMAHVQYILDNGRIDFHNVNLIYFEFPGFPLLNSFLSQVTSLNIFSTRLVYLLSSTTFFTFTLFVFYRKILMNNFIASLAVLLLIQSNIWISLSQSFVPINLSFLYFTSFLILFFIGSLTFERKLLFIILYGALVVGYVSLSFGLLFVFLGLAVSFATSKLSQPQDDLRSRRLSYVFALAFFMFLGWEIYQSVGMFSGLAQWVLTIFNNSLQERFYTFLNVGTSNTTGGVPLWVNLTRFFWIFFICGFGLVKALQHTRHFRSRDQTLRKLLIWLGGFLVFGFLTMLFSPGGAQYHRLMIYLPFFLVPILLMSLSKKKIYVFSLIALLSILSFPTFIAYNPRIAYLSTYPSEIAAGTYLRFGHNSQNEMQIFVIGWTKSACYLNLYDAHFSSESELAYTSTSSFWQHVNVLLANFETEHTAMGTDSIFIFGEKSLIVPEHLLGINSNDTGWEQLNSHLALDNRVYSNGNVILFS